MTLQNLFNKLSEGVSSTTFLTGVGVTGTISTAYFSGRASFKMGKEIQKFEILRAEHNRNIRDQGIEMKEPTFKDKAKEFWPLYVAPVSIGATTIMAIIMANQEASKKITALTVASGISERALVEYKDKVAEKVGKAKVTAIKDEIAQDHVNKTSPPREVIIAGSGDVLCFDITTGRYFVSSVEKIRQSQNRVNFDIIQHMYASLSSFYDEIGLPPTPFSDSVGWNTDHRLEVEFSTVMSPDQRPCIAIDFETPPFVEYSRLW